MFGFHWNGPVQNMAKGGEKRKVLMLSIVPTIVVRKDPFKRCIGAIIAGVGRSVKGVLGNCLCSAKRE